MTGTRETNTKPMPTFDEIESEVDKTLLAIVNDEPAINIAIEVKANPEESTVYVLYDSKRARLSG